jgi:hypothetical protein
MAMIGGFLLGWLLMTVLGKIATSSVQSSCEESACEAAHAAAHPLAGDAFLQLQRPVSKSPRGFHILTITDCHPHQKWLAHVFFSSASEVGQSDPISWVRANCPDHIKLERKKDEELLKSLYPKAELVDVQVDGPMPDKSWIKPAAMKAFVDAHPTMPAETAVALADPDMIFLTKFSIHDLSKRSIPSSDGSGLTKSFSETSKAESFVQGLTGVAQHYICCENTGAPYVLTAGAWRVLVNEWDKPRFESNGKKMYWGSEQDAFSTAALKVGIKFTIFDHFMVSEPDITAPGEGIGWIKNSLIERGAGNTCATGRVGEASLLEKDIEANPMPTFLHVVRPWGIKRLSWYFSKYQVPPGFDFVGDTEGIMACSMPLIAEPPTNLIELAETETEKLNAWGLCSITHSLNSMLRKFKTAKCTPGFNNVSALKYKKSWVNEILPGGLTEIASSQKWVKKCAELCECGPL